AGSAAPTSPWHVFAPNAAGRGSTGIWPAGSPTPARPRGLASWPSWARPSTLGEDRYRPTVIGLRTPASHSGADPGPIGPPRPPGAQPPLAGRPYSRDVSNGGPPVKCRQHQADACHDCRPAIRAAWTVGQLKAALAAI